VREARQAVEGVGAGMRGTLELGILFGLTPGNIRASLAAFHERFPLVQIKLIAPGARGSSSHAERLREGTMDLAVVISVGSLPGINLYPLVREELVLACAPGHRLAGAAGVGLAEIIDESFIDFPFGWGVRSAVDRAFSAAGIQQRHITFEMNDMSTVLDLVRLRLGVAFVPESIIADADDLIFVSVRPDPVTYEIAIGASRAHRLSPVSERFLRIALAR